MVNGLLNIFKLLAILGIYEFKGKMFYIVCWDYDYIGGSYWNLQLDKLVDKCVVIIGIGVIVI